MKVHMRRIILAVANRTVWRVAFTLLLILTVTIGPAQGQEKKESATIDIHLDYRPGQEITTDQLRAFVTDNVVIRFGTDMRPLSVKLQVHLFSREGDIVGDAESETVEIRSGDKVPGSAFALVDWLLDPDVKAGSWVLGQTFVVNHEEQYMPRECEGATHALAIRLVPEEGASLPTFVKNGQPMICMTVRH